MLNIVKIFFVFLTLCPGSTFTLKILIIARGHFHAHLNLNIAFARALTKAGHYVVEFFELYLFELNLVYFLKHFSILLRWTVCQQHLKKALKFQGTRRLLITGRQRKDEMRSLTHWPNIILVIRKTFLVEEFIGRTGLYIFG